MTQRNTVSLQHKLLCRNTCDGSVDSQQVLKKGVTKCSGDVDIKSRVVKRDNLDKSLYMDCRV